MRQNKTNLIQHLNNLLRSKNSLIVLIGSANIILVAAHRTNAIDYNVISCMDLDFMSKYSEFLKSYKNYNIYVLIDNNSCDLQHVLTPKEKVPAHLQQIMNNHDSDQLIAHKVYSDTSGKEQLLDICWARCHIDKTTQAILEYSIACNNYGGVYLATLEYPNIIQALIKQHYKTQEPINQFCIFITTSAANGLQMICMHQDLIILNAHCNIYHKIFDDTNELCKLIEQHLLEIFAKCSDYLEKYQLEPCLVFMAPLNADQVENIKLPWRHNYISIASDEQDLSKNDIALLLNFDRLRAAPALNPQLKSANNFILFEKLALTPAIWLLILLILIVATTKLETLLTDYQNKLLIQQYNTLDHIQLTAQEHPQQAQQKGELIMPYPGKSLMQYYFTRNAANPYQALKQFVNAIKPSSDIKINKISWQLLPITTEFSGDENPYQLSSYIMYYYKDANDVSTGLRRLNRAYYAIKEKFPAQEVAFIKDAYHVENLVHWSSLAATIVIDSKQE
jgi:hypothetical protein